MRRLTAILLFLLFPLCAEANIRFGAGGVVNFVSPVSFGSPPIAATIASSTSGDVSATMTSDIAPSPSVATATSATDQYHYAYKAFDGNIYNYFYSNTLTASGATWLRYTWGGASHKIIKFRIYHQNYLAQGSPKDYQFQGSNDGTSFTDLASATFAQSGPAWIDVDVSNSVYYTYYQLLITSTYDGTKPIVYELEFWE